MALRENQSFNERLFFMTVKIDTVQIHVATEHLVLLCGVVWAMVPKGKSLRHLLRKKK